VTAPSKTHLVLIPSYNTGPLVYQTVRGARACWNPVWVVVDGSDDGTAQELERMARQDPGLKVMVLPANLGKGAAILHGSLQALREGFTHILAMDADGQHPADRICDFMEASAAHPRCMILGEPIFDDSAPLVRVRGRKISNFWSNLETLWAGVHDSLFGFRVYPLAPLVAVMRNNRWMRRFDFDVEVAVRLVWRGVMPVNIPTAVRYLSREEGGVSHFHYVRDNVLLTWMHSRLFAGFLLRLPLLLVRRPWRGWSGSKPV
jgi:glycosyltransferase involved in cell wall biosynthesis